jgi:hypothetical protein
MVNTISNFEAAAQACLPFGAGAGLPLGAVGTAQPREAAAMYRRPRAFWAANVFGHGRMAADLAGVALGQPGSIKQYPHTTRIAASGGAKGPHPAREPEPA